MPLTQAEKDNLLAKADSLRADIAALVVDGAPPPPPPPVPTATISVEPASVESGQAATLTWSTTDADAANINGEPVALSGSRQESPAASATYTLTATGPGGAVQVNATLTVTQPPPPPGGLVIDGYYEFEELHIHAGETLTLLPGAELVRLDVPPADPAHGDGGIVIHGHLQAVRGPSDAPIIIRSQNPTGIRGHLMIHGTAVLDGVEVRDFGRTTNAPISTSNPIARYAVHWHMAGDNGRTSRIENCLVHDTVTPSPYRFGIVIHATHGVVCRNNTVRNKCGSGIYLEDGTEIDNVIEGNTVEDITDRVLSDWTAFPARPDTVESGMEGAAYWTKNANNIFRNNVARRAPYGYMLFPRPSSPPGSVPVYIREFSGNVAESCQKGLEYWEVGGPDQESVFLNFTARDCIFGVYPYPNQRITFDGMVLERCEHGFTSVDYLTRGLIIRNSQFRECQWYAFGDPVNTENHEWLMENCHIDSPVGISITSPITSAYRADWLGPKRGRMRNVTFGPTCTTQIAMVPRELFRTINLQVVDALVVENHNGVAGDNFQVYYLEQAPDYPFPETILNSDGTPRRLACPVAGLTNQQSWDQHGVAWAGAVAPCGTTREKITGFVCP